MIYVCNQDLWSAFQARLRRFPTYYMLAAAPRCIEVVKLAFPLARIKRKLKREGLHSLEAKKIPPSPFFLGYSVLMVGGGGIIFLLLFQSFVCGLLLPSLSCSEAKAKNDGGGRYISPQKIYSRSFQVENIAFRVENIAFQVENIAFTSVQSM